MPQTTKSGFVAFLELSNCMISNYKMWRFDLKTKLFIIEFNYLLQTGLLSGHIKSAAKD